MRVALCLGLVASALAADWAVIVAGSNGYGNYRHQSDACHAYHVAINFGIPAERVILMAYDDIANNAENPYKGQMFNKPTTGAGVDVYKGCVISYKGAEVTPENFVGVLTGVSKKGLPVLKSTASDNVFVFFTDHGATGLIAFPSTTMSVTTLNDALKTAKSKKMFAKLVFYLEACEAGSMFEGVLDPTLGIYATTASNAVESSWGTYCPPDDIVDGKELNSCLGDLYSVSWMENADAVGKSETLQAQFVEVKNATTMSHVMQYGDMTYTSEPIGNFMGDVSSIKTEKVPLGARSSSVVSSRDIPMHLAYYKYLRAEKSDFAGRMALAETLQKHIASRISVDNMFMKLSQQVASTSSVSAESLFFSYPKTPIVCGACCDLLNAAYQTTCGGFDDYSLQYARVFVNMCASANNDLSFASVVANSLASFCKA